MSDRLKARLYLSVIVAGVLFFAGKRYYFAHPGPPPSQTAFFDMWNQDRVSVLEPLPIDTGDIVFVGNSITEGFPLQEMFHTLRVKNRGISGNRSCHIRARIEAIARAQPAKLFLDVGINDILNKVPLDSLKANYEAILQTIRTISPRTKVYVQSVFPLGRTHIEAERSVVVFNEWLMDYCSGAGLVYIDLFTAFYKEGLMNPAYSCDDIHLNGAGYEVWRQRISPYIYPPGDPKVTTPVTKTVTKNYPKEHYGRR